ncbi:MAG: tRNA 2-thiocytidine biosynthesis protein TtcA, partial [Thiohalomonadales bacterium]
IRPLVYARERQTADYAKKAGLPVIKDNCPACFNMPSQRQKMKQLLLQQEQENSHLYKNLLSAMRPLLDPHYYR